MRSDLITLADKTIASLMWCRRSALHCSSLCTMLLLLSLSPALSAQQNAGSAGLTLMARGAVTATATDTQTVRTLKRKAPVFNIDQVVTGAQSQAQFRMLDGALLALQSDTELLISEYKPGSAAEQGSVVMELVKGSLRTVTGSIKGEAGNYQLKTPVGSIGIRGTTFEVSYIGEVMLVGVWNGQIELQITRPDGTIENVVFGLGQTASFASITKSGEVTPLLTPPAGFAGSTGTPGITTSGPGNSAANTLGTTSAFSSALAGGAPGNSSASGGQGVVPGSPPNPQLSNATAQISGAQPENTSFIAEKNYQGNVNVVADLVAARTGRYQYGTIEQFDVKSSAGQVSNFNVSLTIDFDNGTVPQGELSFNDAGGEWFAAFNGAVNVDKLDLGINFASHGNERAQGKIDTLFVDGIDKILGQFVLSEIANPATTAGGIFIIK